MLRLLALLLGLISASALAQTEYDTLRARWVTMISGGNSYSLNDPDIAQAVAKINDEAAAYHASMDTTPTRTYLWSDKAGKRSSPKIKETYRRLRSMALAYRTHGASLEGNAALLSDLVGAMDWMYTNCYNETIATPPSSADSNWWDWEIGIALSVNDITALLYDQLTAGQRANYMNAVDRYTHEVGMSGANRSWQMIIVGVRGVLVGDGSRISLARDGFIGNYGLFNYQTATQEGYYSDGTFNQHKLPYNGGYGVSCLEDVTNLIALLEGSTWEVPNRQNYPTLLRDSYQSLIHRGTMMDVFRGREISREGVEDHVTGHAVIEAFLRAATVVPPADANSLKREVKAWITSDTYRAFLATASLPAILMAKPILSDSAIVPAAPEFLGQSFSRGDRLVVKRPGFSFALGMFSARFDSYESINSENNRGWYTSSGTGYLYNGDLGQYGGNYWPTVDAYRLPGTTVTSQTMPCLVVNGKQGSKTTSPWTGSIELLNTYASAGMELDYPATDSLGNPMVSVTARKSWFVFDDKIIALGAGIGSSDGISIETIVENRRLTAAGNEAFVVNGVAQPTGLGWNQTLGGVSRAHFAGATAGSDIGYYFPSPVTLNACRTARQGRWREINKNGSNTYKTENYLTFWINHGVSPVAQSYSYAVLPNFSVAQVDAFAANPTYTVLQNTTAVQAVQESSTGLIGANFWNDGLATAGWITVDRKALVLAREKDGILDVSLADPTQLSTNPIQLELGHAAVSLVSADAGVTITQLSPTIKLSAAVSGAKGRTFHAKFSTAIIVDNLDAGVTITGSWNNNGTEPDHYGADYLYDGNTGKGLKNVLFRPSLPQAGTYAVYAMWADASNRATNVPIDIFHDGAMEPEIIVNQKTQGGQWVPLGAYSFASGTGGYVRIRNTNTNGHVVADAIRFVRVP